MSFFSSFFFCKVGQNMYTASTLDSGKDVGPILINFVFFFKGLHLSRCSTCPLFFGKNLHLSKNWMEFSIKSDFNIFSFFNPTWKTAYLKLVTNRSSFLPFCPNRTSQSKFCFPNLTEQNRTCKKVHKHLELNCRSNKQRRNKFKLIRYEA